MEDIHEVMKKLRSGGKSSFAALESDLREICTACLQAYSALQETGIRRSVLSWDLTDLSIQSQAYPRVEAYTPLVRYHYTPLGKHPDDPILRAPYPLLFLADVEIPLAERAQDRSVPHQAWDHAQALGLPHRGAGDWIERSVRSQESAIG